VSPVPSGGRRIFPECKRRVARLRVRRAQNQRSTRAQEGGAAWDAYVRAYQDLIRETATPEAPWYVVPADNKWFSRIVVAAAVDHALEKLDLAYPKVDADKKKELAAARTALGGDKKQSPRAGQSCATSFTG